MKKYKVTLYEVWTKEYFVEAENKQDAVDKAEDGDFVSEGEFEYHDMLANYTVNGYGNAEVEVITEK